MQGYDLDDTLARVNFARTPLAEMFATAPVIYTPTSDFVVLTGRPNDTAAQREATTTWLREHQPHCRGIHYVAGGEIEKAKRKAAIIKRLRLSDYTDNNPDALAAIATADTGAQLWRMSADGIRTKFASRTGASDTRDMAQTLWTTDGPRVVRFDGTPVFECASEHEAAQVIGRLSAAVQKAAKKQCAACSKREKCACGASDRQCAACGKKECSGCGKNKQCAACGTRQHAACGGNKPDEDTMD